MFIKSIKKAIDANELLKEMQEDMKWIERLIEEKKLEGLSTKYYQGSSLILDKYITELKRIVNN